MKILGYRRKNGKIGIRNHVVILPTSICASDTAVKISNLVTGSIALPHQNGCCQVGKDYRQTLKTLIGIGSNPNVGAVLVVGLGCEGIRPEIVVEEIKKEGQFAKMITIQECGSTLETIAEGTKIAKEMTKKLSVQRKEEVDLNELVLGIECGGSDPTSGISANPAVGVAADLLINYGGTVMLSETTELIGAEHILAKRAINQQVADKLLKIVEVTENRAIDMGEDLRGSQPTPGNIQGGLTTIEEKSLGCIYKSGSSYIKGILDYAEKTKGKGLYIMDTPGQDIESITGMVAGGAQIIIFTTGRGTPTGSPIAPVVKITGNSVTYSNMMDNIDMNAGKIIDEGFPIQDMGQEIFNKMLEVANGKLTKSELLGHREFAIYRIGYTF